MLDTLNGKGKYVVAGLTLCILDIVAGYSIGSLASVGFILSLYSEVAEKNCHVLVSYKFSSLE